MSRTFAVGDIHGELEKLQQLLVILQDISYTGDTLVFVGDYIDRGPDSAEVVSEVLNLKSGAWDGPVVTLRGNHEAMLLDYLGSKQKYEDGVWFWNGGYNTIISYLRPYPLLRAAEFATCLPPVHLELFRNTQLWYEDEHALYVHAGFRPEVEPEDADPEDCLWIRKEFLESDYAWRKAVVFGHTPQCEGLMKGPGTLWRPTNEPTRIGIDTGVAYGGPLTAVMLPEREFFSVR